MSWDSPAKGPRRTFRIGKYKILSHIATGGMGAVYKAYDTENKREAALKLLSREMASKPTMVERFKREARHSEQLRHENIVTLYEFAEAKGTYFIAMEFVDGIDLHEYITRKKVLDPEESRQIMIQASKALEHAHKHGIVHRDIKPSNFLVCRKHGQILVKLTDLGLSRQTTTDEFRVTRAGTTVGTVDYISPEQARDSGAADIRSDLYSLGCTWYHMLTGKAPFSEGGLAERLFNHINKEPEDVRKLNPRVTEAARAVLNRMLAKEPADRYQTPTELLNDLMLLDKRKRPPAARDVVEGLVEEEVAEDVASSAATKLIPVASPTKRKVRRKRLANTGNSSNATEVDEAKPAQPIWLCLMLGVAFLLLLAGIVLALFLRIGR